MSYTTILVLSFGLLSHVKADDRLQFHLPLSKKYLTTCHEQVLTLYSGIIEKQNLFEIPPHFFVQYAIQMPNRKMQTVICNLDNGYIVQTTDIQQ